MSMRKVFWPAADSTTSGQIVAEELRWREDQDRERDQAALALNAKLETIDAGLEKELTTFGKETFFTRQMGRKGASWTRNRPVREACLEPAMLQHALEVIRRTRGRGPW
jgi:hypothetical protein